MEVWTMRRYLLLMAVFLSQTVSGQTLLQVWQQMPDSLSPLLTSNMRTELYEYYKMGGSAQVKNAFNSYSTLELFDERNICVRLSESNTFHIRLLQTAEGDSVVCLVKTFKGPAAESDVCLYSTEWKLIERLSFDNDSFFLRPDSMTEERFDELKSQVSPLMVEATWEGDADELILSLSLPFVQVADRDALNAIRVQRKVKWDGKNLN